MLRAQAACHFFKLDLPKVFRCWCALQLLTSKCASRAGGVPIFVNPSARRVRTRRFSEPTFRASWTHKLLKNTAFGDFPNISRTRICCLPDSLTIHLLLYLLICYIFCCGFFFSDISDLLSPDSLPCPCELT